MSARTNQKVENDKIKKAVQDARVTWEAKEKSLGHEIRELKQERDADVRNICELSRMRDIYARRESGKDTEIEELKSQLEEERRKQKQSQDASEQELLAALKAERVKNKCLEDGLRNLSATIDGILPKKV